MKIDTILAATDLSDISKPAIEFAAETAREKGAKLVLVHALDPAIYDSHDLYMSVGERAKLFENQRDEAIEAMRAMLSEELTRSITVERRVVHMEAAEGILETAKKVGAQMIVIGTHGRSGLSRLMYGSVAEEVMRGATCPVATIRPNGDVDKNPLPDSK